MARDLADRPAAVPQDDDEMWERRPALFLITELETIRATWGDRILPIVRDRGMGPCHREWFLTGQRQPPSKARTERGQPCHWLRGRQPRPRIRRWLQKSHLTTLPLGSSERVRYRCSSQPGASACTIVAYCAAEDHDDRCQNTFAVSLVSLALRNSGIFAFIATLTGPPPAVLSVPCMTWQTSDWPAA